MPIKYPIENNKKKKKLATNHQAEKHSSFGLNLCKN
jgi:hypothetical protein